MIVPVPVSTLSHKHANWHCVHWNAQVGKCECCCWCYCSAVFIRSCVCFDWIFHGNTIKLHKRAAKCHSSFTAHLHLFSMPHTHPSAYPQFAFSIICNSITIVRALHDIPYRPIHGTTCLFPFGFAIRTLLCDPPHIIWQIQSNFTWELKDFFHRLLIVISFIRYEMNWGGWAKEEQQKQAEAGLFFLRCVCNAFVVLLVLVVTSLNI